MAKEFGVSLIPVKDALLILQGEGLIINVPRRGSIVRQFSLRDVIEMVQVRQILELEAAALALQNNAVDERLLEGLREHNEVIGKVRNDQGGWAERLVPYRNDRLFHELMVSVCGNNLLVEWYKRLNSQAQVIRLTFYNIGPRGDKTYNEHNAIVQGLADGRLGDVKLAIKNHLKSLVEDYRKAAKANPASLGLDEGGEPALPHGRRQLKSKKSNAATD